MFPMSRYVQISPVEISFRIFLECFRYPISTQTLHWSNRVASCVSSSPSWYICENAWGSFVERKKLSCNDSATIHPFIMSWDLPKVDQSRDDGYDMMQLTKSPALRLQKGLQGAHHKRLRYLRVDMVPGGPSFSEKSWAACYRHLDAHLVYPW